MAWPYFVAAGLLPPHDEAAAASGVDAWFGKLLALFLPSVSQLDELPAKAAFVFRFGPDACARRRRERTHPRDEATRKVLAAFGARAAGHVEGVIPEQFKAWMNEIKGETGAKGKDLFHPVRIALTGFHSGPEFDKLIPVLEEGSRLDLPVHVLSVRERIEQFMSSGMGEGQ